MMTHEQRRRKKDKKRKTEKQRKKGKKGPAIAWTERKKNIDKIYRIIRFENV